MTNRIDRLATAGFVSRQPDPQDKRGVLVTLTAHGQATVDAALADLLRSERQLLTGLDARQLRALAGMLRVLLAPLDARQRPPKPGEGLVAAPARLDEPGWRG
jgi:DNA-binding MarR family transcriptional regulator